MKNEKYHRLIVLIAVLLTTALSSPAWGEGVVASYLYTLSNFTGAVPYSWTRISIDREKGEIYVISKGSVSIFNERGMEIYNFGSDTDIGAVADVAVDKDGNIFVLSYHGYSTVLTLCNFRGEPVSRIEMKNLPQELSGFSPDRMIYREGLLYLVSLNSMRMIMASTDGDFKEAYDLASLAGIEEEERADTGIAGFNIDKEGNMLFTVPVIAKAYVISPDRKVRSFGKRGSAPGKFGVPAGIAADASGNYYVSDTLRCVVMAFDKDFKFLTEFGFRGIGPGNLIGPGELALDNSSRLYVSQLRRRGVSVFKISES
jgi:DNA-binding beta-propeller fold protein YncE